MPPQPPSSFTCPKVPEPCHFPIDNVTWLLRTRTSSASLQAQTSTPCIPHRNMPRHSLTDTYPASVSSFDHLDPWGDEEPKQQGALHAGDLSIDSSPSHTPLGSSQWQASGPRRYPPAPAPLVSPFASNHPVPGNDEAEEGTGAPAKSDAGSECPSQTPSSLPMHTASLRVEADKVGLLLGHGGRHIIRLRHELGVHLDGLQGLRTNEARTLIISSDVLRRVLDAVTAVKAILEDPNQFLKLMNYSSHSFFVQPQPQDKSYAYRPFPNRISVIVDNSNVFIGAQQYNSANEPGFQQDFSVRLDIPALTRLIEKGRATFARVVAGSFVFEASGYWKVWADMGYRVNAFNRNVGSKEFGVDECLFEETSVLFQHPPSSRFVGHAQHTIVMVTGDGNENEGRPSLRNVVEQALQLGFRVELWAWSHACSMQYCMQVYIFYSLPRNI